jgi:hypothetical protein
MIDSEVARLRRLRREALRVREVARALGSTQSANDLLERGACASWRIARVVSGRLKAHPYLRYQKDVGIGSIVGNGLFASFLAMITKDGVQALKRFESQVHALMRHLDDTRALIWSSDFSDTLGRSQYELQSLLEDLAQITKSTVPAAERLPKRANRTDNLVGELARTVEGDWPYLAF